MIALLERLTALSRWARNEPTPVVNGQQNRPKPWIARLFQTELEVQGPDGEPVFVKRALPEEEQGQRVQHLTRAGPRSR
jgi:hypothetical protein